MFKMKQMGVAAALILIAAGAMASNFRGADQVYVPAAGHVTAGPTTFISDVWVSNLSAVDSVSVSIIYTPLGQTPTPQYFDNQFTLRPLERKEIIDFFPTLLGVQSAFGSLIFNGCKANSDCIGTQDANGVSPNFRDIAVFSRIYSIPASSTLAQNPPTNGQDMPGIPWYNFISSRQSSNGLGEVFITGLRNTGTSGTAGTYRGNIGLFNASQYSTTTIRAKLWNGSSPTQQIGSDYTVTLGPLGFVQPSVGQMFPAYAPGPTSTNAFVTISQEANVPTNDAPSTCLPDGCPGFLVYGSVLDNSTQDATTLEAVYEKALSGDALNVIYGSGTPRVSNIRRAVKRNH
jgi:hypothetical protein